MDLSWIYKMLSELNSFERVKRRELKYTVNGVSRRMSQANYSPFRKSYLSLSIKASAHFKLQCKYYCWNHFAVTRITCRSILRCQWSTRTRGTKAFLKVLKKSITNITPRNVSVSSKDILTFLYDGHSISFTVASIMEGPGSPTMWGSTIAKKPGRILPNLWSASKKTVKMSEIILISM